MAGGAEQRKGRRCLCVFVCVCFSVYLCVYEFTCLHKCVGRYMHVQGLVLDLEIPSLSQTGWAASKHHSPVSISARGFHVHDAMPSFCRGAEDRLLLLMHVQQECSMALVICCLNSVLLTG